MNKTIVTKIMTIITLSALIILSKLWSASSEEVKEVRELIKFEIQK